MYSMFGGNADIKLQWYNIFPSLFFLFLILKRNFFPLQLRHQTSATKLRYLQSSAFYRQPKKEQYKLLTIVHYWSAGVSYPYIASYKDTRQVLLS